MHSANRADSLVLIPDSLNQNIDLSSFSTSIEKDGFGTPFTK